MLPRLRLRRSILLLALWSQPVMAMCPAVEAVRDAPDRITPVAVQVGVGPGPTEHALTEHMQRDLESAFAQVVAETDLPAAGAAVVVPDLGRWDAVHNSRPDQVFGVGTIGQAATAALILDAVARGRISLADPVARWFPAMRGASHNSIDQLLTHHAGYRDFDLLPALKHRVPAERPQRLMRFTVRRSGDACPTHTYTHSNTNYLILGLILEQEHDQLFHELEIDQTLTPLGLYRSRAMERGMPPPELIRSVDPGGQPVPSVDHGTFHGAGNLAMTPRELATFWHALLSGQHVAPDRVDRMLDGWSRVPNPPLGTETYAGRGTLLFQSPSGEDWLVGQASTTRGFHAMVAWSSTLDAVIAVTTTGTTSPAPTFWAMYHALTHTLETPEPR